MVPNLSSSKRIAAISVRAFVVSGWVMAIAALNSLLFEIFPLKLLDPLWQLKLIGQSMAVVMPTLVGMLVIQLAANINTKTTDLYDNAQVARRVSLWIAVVLFLFIPLQFHAGAKIVRQMKEADKGTIRTIRQFVNRLRLTSNEREMRILAASIPDPPVLPDKLEAPFIQVRDDWAERLVNDANQKEEEFTKKYNVTWQKYLANSARNAIQAGLFGFAFLTISQRPNRGDKLFETLTSYGRRTNN